MRKKLRKEKGRGCKKGHRTSTDHIHPTITLSFFLHLWTKKEEEKEKKERRERGRKEDGMKNGRKR